MKHARSVLGLVCTCLIACCFAQAAAAQPATSGWTAQTSGTTQDLKGEFWVDATHGWAVGGGGIILRTTDGGVTWTPQTSGTTRTLWVALFIDAQRGWAAGDAGTACATPDAGQTWIAVDAWKLNSMDIHGGMVAPDGLHALGVGSRGGIIATDNGGERGIAMPSGTTADLWGVSFTDAYSGWVVGAQGTIIHTTNGAYAWAPQASGTTQTLYGVAFTDASHGWAVGGAGTILATKDGGQTWSAQTSGTTEDLYAVAFATSMRGWAVGDHGVVLATVDGGLHWVSQVSGTTRLLRCVRFSDNLHGSIVGDGGIILTTSNGGVPPDSTPPTTTSDAGTGWHNADVTVHFTATDGPGGSGVAFTEYSLDDGTSWTLGTSLTIAAPADHSADGVHEILFNSKDLADNLETPKTCQVNIDTTAPTTSGLKAVTVKSGKRAKLSLRVSDMKGASPLSPTAVLTLTVSSLKGKVLKVALLGTKPTNAAITCTWKCSLKPGSYRYSVTALDAAGNPQAAAASQKLTVE
jgi:photosystem II stability/assembly factor-like uncharacterized protein